MRNKSFITPLYGNGFVENNKFIKGSAKNGLRGLGTES